MDNLLYPQPKMTPSTDLSTVDGQTGSANDKGVEN